MKNNENHVELYPMKGIVLHGENCTLCRMELFPFLKFFKKYLFLNVIY